MTARSSVALAAVLALVAACGDANRSRGRVPGVDHVRPGASGPGEAHGEARGEAAGELASRLRAVDRGEADAAGLAELVFDAGAAELDASWPSLRAPGPARALVALRRAVLADHVGERAMARRWLEHFAAAGGDAVVGSAAAAVAASLGARLDALDAVRGDVVALIAPRSGTAAALGAEIETAVRLAAGDEAKLRLVVLDSAGTGDGAVRAVERAVLERGAVAILGPVGAIESAAAAARAVELGVPIALLAPEADGAEPGVGVFRLTTAPAWEAEQAALAAVALGYDAVAVLAPRDEVGEIQARAFARAAQGAGARVVADGRYDPTTATLEDDVKRFLGLDPIENERLRRHLRAHGKRGYTTFSPDVDFDLLYLPDSVERGTLVAAYLPYFNVELRTGELMDPHSLRRKHGGRVPRVVQLLGSSGWNRPTLLARGGAAVTGALVLDACPGADTTGALSPGSASFTERFTSATGRAPSRLAAEASDAAELVFSARAEAAGAADPRRALAASLSRGRLIDGACGPARVDARGQLVREIVLLRVGASELSLHEW